MPYIWDAKSIYCPIYWIYEIKIKQDVLKQWLKRQYGLCVYAAFSWDVMAQPKIKIK